MNDVVTGKSAECGLCRVGCAQASSEPLLHARHVHRRGGGGESGSPGAERGEDRSHLVGIRHQLQGEPDPRWLLRPDVLSGPAAVSEADSSTTWW